MGTCPDRCQVSQTAASKVLFQPHAYAGHSPGSSPPPLILRSLYIYIFVKSLHGNEIVVFPYPCSWSVKSSSPRSLSSSFYDRCHHHNTRSWNDSKLYGRNSSFWGHTHGYTYGYTAVLTSFYLSEMSHLKITLDITNLFRRQEWVTKSIATVLTAACNYFQFFKPSNTLQEWKTAWCQCWCWRWHLLLRILSKTHFP